MKIGIYSDVHFSITSSILSRINGYKYSSRLDSIVDSFKWMYEVFSSENVDLIISGGDLTSSDILKPEENSAIYEALSYSCGTPEEHILGNHEIKDKNSRYNSVSLLKGYSNITLIDSIVEKVYDSNIHIIYVPYTSNKDNYNKLYNLLDNSDKSHKYYIVSHMSYIGENYNNYIETEGLDKIRLMDNYDNVKAIFNGHIHNVKDDRIYHQIGSLVGNSFSDNYEEGYPGVIIYDTDTDKMTRIINPNAVLFFKMKVTSIRALSTQLGKLPTDNGKCVRIEVPSSIKDDASKYLSDKSDKYKIVEYRVKTQYEPNSKSNIDKIESLSTYKSPYDALIGFINSQNSLPYPQEDMVQFLNNYVRG